MVDVNTVTNLPLLLLCPFIADPLPPSLPHSITNSDPTSLSQCVTNSPPSSLPPPPPLPLSLPHALPISLTHHPLPGIWAKFHEFWLEVSRQIPVLTVRYEDLLDDSERGKTLTRIEAFMTVGSVDKGVKDGIGNGCRNSEGNGDGSGRGPAAAPPVCWQRLKQKEIQSNVNGAVAATTTASSSSASSSSSSSSAAASSASCSDTITNGGALPSGGPGYLPKRGGIGKGLRLLNNLLVEKVLQQAGHVMQVCVLSIHRVCCQYPLLDPSQISTLFQIIFTVITSYLYCNPTYTYCNPSHVSIY